MTARDTGTAHFEAHAALLPWPAATAVKFGSTAHITLFLSFCQCLSLVKS